MPVPIDSIRRLSTITIPKQDISFDPFDFQFCLPRTDIKDESKELEAAYCRDFACCGLVLNDLHDLLQHYEECHVSVEEDGDEEYQLDEDIQWNSPFDDHLDTMKKKAAAYLSDLYNTQKEEEEEEEEQVVVGKKRPASTALDLLTQSAVKKLALASSVNGQDLPTPILSDEDFLAQAGALLASANNIFQSDSNADKPYKCSVKGCDKAYKNPNGLKYHNQHGHCNLLNEDDENLSSKPYQCTIGECGKRYKNLNGLKYHIEHSHMAALNQTLASFGTLSFTPPPTPPLLD